MTQISVDRGYSIEQMHSRLVQAGQQPEKKTSGVCGQSFAEVLELKTAAKSGELRFSKHANERLVSRNIDLSETQKERLNQAVKAAQAKGIKESLVMMDNLAFIVNIKSNTVVTAVAGGEERIFSNIDGAVVV